MRLIYLKDYVICEVLSATEAQCTDRAPVSTRNAPPLDAVDPDLEVTAVTINADWTTVTFLRAAGATDDQDYDLGEVGKAPIGFCSFEVLRREPFQVHGAVFCCVVYYSTRVAIDVFSGATSGSKHERGP